jgi:transposase
MNNTIVGVDLAKDVIQVCIVKDNKVISNEEVTPVQFMFWLLNSKPVTIIFEACSMSNYWKQEALKQGHNAKIVSARLVAMIRQNQKTDKNDALAVAQASQLVDVNFINGKTFQQQEMQFIMRMRDLAIKHKIALHRQITALLLEFNIRVSSRNGGLKGVIQGVLENAENGFIMPFREALDATWQQYLFLIDTIKTYELALERVIKDHPECEKLLALEGVGIINAVNLYITIGCSDIGVFKSGRDISACIGLTPVQHSSGGKTKIGSISKRVRSSSLRSCLVNGAMSIVNLMDKREPKTEKERWLKALIERRGKLCAAVALANKTVRTAFAMLTQGTEYKAQPLQA